MLKGQAKTDYQREYMRRYRSNERSNKKAESVRPSKTQDVRPKTTFGAGQKIEDASVTKHELDVRSIKTQNYNPMMVGYVPPGKDG